MKIVVINLENNPERLVEITENLKNLNVPFERFNAIYGKKLSDKEIEVNTTFLSRNLLCNYGMIGCAMSHLTVWREFISSDEDFICISEDDVTYNKKFPKLLKDVNLIYDKLKFDYLSLSCSVGISNSFSNEIKIGEYKFNKPIFPLTTASYILSKKGAQKLIKYFDKINYHIDFSISVNNLFKDVEYYYLKSPDILYVRHDDSNIIQKNNGLLNITLNNLGLKKINWLISNTVFTIKLKTSISVYALMLMIIIVLCIIKKYYIASFILFLELCLVLGIFYS
jgi:glycosyl transferase family 25